MPVPTKTTAKNPAVSGVNVNDRYENIINEYLKIGYSIKNQSDNHTELSKVSVGFLTAYSIGMFVLTCVFSWFLNLFLGNISSASRSIIIFAFFMIVVGAIIYDIVIRVKRGKIIIRINKNNDVIITGHKLNRKL